MTTQGHTRLTFCHSIGKIDDPSDLKHNCLNEDFKPDPRSKDQILYLLGHTYHLGKACYIICENIYCVDSLELSRGGQFKTHISSALKYYPQI